MSEGMNLESDTGSDSGDFADESPVRHRPSEDSAIHDKKSNSSDEKFDMNPISPLKLLDDFGAGFAGLFGKFGGKNSINHVQNNDQPGKPITDADQNPWTTDKVKSQGEGKDLPAADPQFINMFVTKSPTTGKIDSTGNSDSTVNIVSTGSFAEDRKLPLAIPDDRGNGKKKPNQGIKRMNTFGKDDPNATEEVSNPKEDDRDPIFVPKEMNEIKTFNVGFDNGNKIGTIDSRDKKKFKRQDTPVVGKEIKFGRKNDSEEVVKFGYSVVDEESKSEYDDDASPPTPGASAQKPKNKPTAVESDDPIDPIAKKPKAHAQKPANKPTVVESDDDLYDFGPKKPKADTQKPANKPTVVESDNDLYDAGPKKPKADAQKPKNKPTAVESDDSVDSSPKKPNADAQNAKNKPTVVESDDSVDSSPKKPNDDTQKPKDKPRVVESDNDLYDAGPKKPKADADKPKIKPIVVESHDSVESSPKKPKADAQKPKKKLPTIEPDDMFDSSAKKPKADAEDQKGKHGTGESNDDPIDPITNNPKANAEDQKGKRGTGESDDPTSKKPARPTEKSSKDKKPKLDTSDNGDLNISKADPSKPNKDGSKQTTRQLPADTNKKPKISGEIGQKKPTGDSHDQEPSPDSKKPKQDKPKDQNTPVDLTDSDAKDKKPKQDKSKSNKLATGESEIVTKKPQDKDKGKDKDKPPTDWQEGSGSDGGIGDSPNKNPKKPKPSKPAQETHQDSAEIPRDGKPKTNTDAAKGQGIGSNNQTQDFPSKKPAKNGGTPVNDGYTGIKPSFNIKQDPKFISQQ